MSPVSPPLSGAAYRFAFDEPVRLKWGSANAGSNKGGTAGVQVAPPSLMRDGGFLLSETRRCHSLPEPHQSQSVDGSEDDTMVQTTPPRPASRPRVRGQLPPSIDELR